MQNIEVQEIKLSNPITAIGKVFIGDYGNSQQYITEVHDLLSQKSIPFIDNKVMGVYYDNPQDKKPEELRSFQGAFLSNQSDIDKIDSTLTQLTLQGNCIYTKISGDPIQSIFEGYGALFNYIQDQKITLRSNSGYQISTYENGRITTEIYMEVQIQ